jgi:hypothetical protein
MAAASVWAILGILSAERLVAAPRESGDTAEEKPAAPRYRQIPPDDEVLKAVSKHHTAFAAALRAGSYSGEQQQMAEDYLKKFLVPSWTLPANFPKLAKVRSDLRRELGTGRGKPHADAVSSLLDSMTKLAEGNFAPVTRVNAMLLIGDLNEQEPATPRDSPVPLADAFTVLVGAATGDKQPDAIKVAALVGLTRHARLNAADPQVVAQQLRPKLIELAGARTPPRGRSADGHDWMRCVAIKLLGLLRSAEPENSVAKVLGAIIVDQRNSIYARSVAAETLNNLDYSHAGGLNPTVYAVAVGRLALESCDSELKAATKEDRDISRRPLRAVLNSVSIGLTGLRTLAHDLGPPHADDVDKLNERVQALMSPFDEKTRKQEPKEKEAPKPKGKDKTKDKDSPKPKVKEEEISDPDLHKKLDEGIAALSTVISDIEARMGTAATAESAAAEPAAPAEAKAAAPAAAKPAAAPSAPRKPR